MGLESKAGRSHDDVELIGQGADTRPLLPPSFSRKLKAENGKEGALSGGGILAAEDMSNYPKLSLSPTSLLSNHYGEACPYSELLKSLSVLYQYCLLDFRPKEKSS